jgi:hypothetical protein
LNADVHAKDAAGGAEAGVFRGGADDGAAERGGAGGRGAELGARVLVGVSI